MSASPSASVWGSGHPPQEPKNSEGLLIWGLLDQERKSGEVCSVPAQGPVQAGGPGADPGRGWRGEQGQGNSLFLCSLQLAGRGREREDSFQGGSLAQSLLGGRGRGL